MKAGCETWAKISDTNTEKKCFVSMNNGKGKPILCIGYLLPLNVIGTMIRDLNKAVKELFVELQGNVSSRIVQVFPKDTLKRTSRLAADIIGEER